MSSTSKSISRTSTIQQSSTSIQSSSNKEIVTIGAEELVKMPSVPISHNNIALTDNQKGALIMPVYENAPFQKQSQFQYCNEDPPAKNQLSSSLATSSFSAKPSTDMKITSRTDAVSDILISHSAMSMESTKKQLTTAASSTCTKTSSALLKSFESVERACIKTSSNMELEIDS